MKESAFEGKSLFEDRNQGGTAEFIRPLHAYARVFFCAISRKEALWRATRAANVYGCEACGGVRRLLIAQKERENKIKRQGTKKNLISNALTALVWPAEKGVSSKHERKTGKDQGRGASSD